MKIYIYPTSEELKIALARPVLNQVDLEGTVKGIFDDVKKNGDTAIRTYSKQFDQVDLNDLKVSENEIIEAISLVPEDLKTAIQVAADNIRTFHATQKEETVKIETMPGVVCWRKSVGIEKVGLYIPGGTAPLFSTVLMLGIPAILVECKKIIFCTPSGKDGKVNPAILFTANLIGIKEIYKIGGIQAIAGMTIGTETIPAVYKLFGPGNQYVTAAKQYAQKLGVAIDMPAGPSEVMVVADESANPAFIAADLLSQAEHGSDSQVVLVSTDQMIISAVEIELTKQLDLLPRKEMATKALENSSAIVVQKPELISVINEYAPEHLILQTSFNEELINGIINAGSVFIGDYTPESAGDYASGTNHTLPTNGYAKQYSGVSLDSFVKKITFQEISENGIQNLGPTVETMAAAEGLDAHKNAVTIRLNSLSRLIGKKKFELESLIRPDLMGMKPYSSARDEFEGTASIYLDANENPFNNGVNRYPDPLQKKLKQRIAEIKGINAEQLFLGNGSDECIDLLFRLFCRPGIDKVATISPSYGMYAVSARINQIEVVEILLNEDFSLDTERMFYGSKNCKILFLCSPNNPSGQSFPQSQLVKIVEKFQGIVVVDEAYIDFSTEGSMLTVLNEYPNLVVSQTFSKACGMAGIRLGMLFGSIELISWINKIKPPYNINLLTQEFALNKLNDLTNVRSEIEIIRFERDKLLNELLTLEQIETVYPSDSNFILIKVEDANKMYSYLTDQGIVVRNRSNQPLCFNTLRLTIGIPEENKKLLAALKLYNPIEP